MSKNKEKPPKSEGGKTMRGQLEKWQAAQSEPEKEQAAPEKDIVEELEAEAASEDLDFKKFENHFFDVKKNLEEFEDFIKNHGLEKGLEEVVADLKNKEEEMKSLLKNKNYQKFTESQNIFDDILEDLYVKIEKAKAEVEEEKKEQEQKEHEERKHLYGRREEDFILLSRIIKGTDVREQGKRKLVDEYREKMRVLQGYLDEAYDKRRNPKVFQAKINNFDKDLKSLVADLKPDLKELFDNGGVLPKKEPAEEIEPVTEDQIIEEKPLIEPEPEKLTVVKRPPSKVKVSEEYLQEVAARNKAQIAAANSAPKAPEPVKENAVEVPPSPSPEPKKKGLWGKLKEGVKGVFNRETGKVA